MEEPLLNRVLRVLVREHDRATHGVRPTLMHAHELREGFARALLRRDHKRPFVRPGVTHGRRAERQFDCRSQPVIEALPVSTLINGRQYANVDRQGAASRAPATGGSARGRRRSRRGPIASASAPHRVDHELDVLIEIDAQLLYAHRKTSSRLTPFANALSFIFFLTERASTSWTLLRRLDRARSP
jgi:hypothetical protein